MDEPYIDYKRAGMLRRMPTSLDEGKPLDGSVRAGWGALERAGLAESRGGLFRRSPAGERWLAEYDANLGPQDLALLERVRTDAKTLQGSWAVHRMVGAGLACLGVRSNGIPGITPAGLALLGRARLAA